VVRVFARETVFEVSGFVFSAAQFGSRATARSVASNTGLYLSDYRCAAITDFQLLRGETRALVIARTQTARRAFCGSCGFDAVSGRRNAGLRRRVLDRFRLFDGPTE
jgi:hypothetical protein